jgi:hypothetical protein
MRDRLKQANRGDRSDSVSPATMARDGAGQRGNRARKVIRVGEAVADEEDVQHQRNAAPLVRLAALSWHRFEGMALIVEVLSERPAPSSIVAYEVPPGRHHEAGE